MVQVVIVEQQETQQIVVQTEQVEQQETQQIVVQVVRTTCTTIC